MTEPLGEMRVGVRERFEAFYPIMKNLKLGFIRETTDGSERFFQQDELLGSILPRGTFQLSYPIITDERFRSVTRVTAQWELGKGFSVGPFVGLATYVDPLRGAQVEHQAGGIAIWRF